MSEIHYTRVHLFGLVQSSRFAFTTHNYSTLVCTVKQLVNNMLGRKPAG